MPVAVHRPGAAIRLLGGNQLLGIGWLNADRAQDEQGAGEERVVKLLVTVRAATDGTGRDPGFSGWCRDTVGHWRFPNLYSIKLHVATGEERQRLPRPVSSSGACWQCLRLGWRGVWLTKQRNRWTRR